MRVQGLIAAAVTAVGLLSGQALAQQPEQVIAFLDKNGDGQCDLNEYLTFQVGKLAEFDENTDGALSLPEFRNSLQGEGKKNANMSFNAFNSEGGRTLSQKEFLGYHAYVFRTFIDTDKDGFMSAAEWSKIVGLG